MIAAVLDDSPERHSKTVQALLRAGGNRTAQSKVPGITLLACGEPTLGRLDGAGRLASIGALDALGGVDADRLRQLRGDFALIARGDGVVRLARGYFGGRSLYFSIPDPSRSTIACSRLGPLVSALGCKATIDRERLALLMAARGDNGLLERSPFAEILRVGPGQIIELHSTGHSIAGALDLPQPVPHFESAPPEEVAAELRSRLMSVVARQLEGLERVAVMASGGIDSSAVLAAAVTHARQRGRPRIDVLTVDTTGPGDDRPYFEVLCRHLDVKPVRFSPSQCAPYLRRSWTMDATPSVWPNGAWELPLLEAARARGAAVVLTGIGGDDVFEGDPWLFGADARRGHLVGAVTSAVRLRAYSRPTAWGRVRDFVLRPLVTPWVPRRARSARLRLLARRASPWATPFAHEVIERTCSLPEPRPETGEQLIARLAVAQHLVEPVDSRTRIEEATGCAFRDPLFAPELVELVASIPARMLMHGNRLRGLFRLALQGLVPDAVRLRSDKASFEPALTEMLGAAGGLSAFRDLADARELGRLGLVETRTFEHAFTTAASGHGRPSWARWSRLWPVLALEAFVRAHEEDRWDDRHERSAVA